ncbi:MAG TPA: 3-dehydroquinate synthase, partial [Blastocatellia bacterium]|nr:3-dehydroquinate synthase [Blastocatellia bacterium]
MRTIAVKLGLRSYQVQISTTLLDEIGERARAALGAKAKHAVLVSNEIVDALYGARVLRSLTRADFKVHRFSIGDGERFKSLRTAESLFAFLIERRVERSDVIL